MTNTNRKIFLIWAASVLALNATSTHAQSLPPIRNSIETYCAANPADWETTAECQSRQEFYSRQVESLISTKGVQRGREMIAECSNFTTGLRSLGSMETLDSELLAKCLVLPHREQVFQGCVTEVTGRPMTGSTIHWKRNEAIAIANCFNAQLARLR
ncbi:hypothetical protein G0D86_29755 (plasmid) [Burkholderia multivorans]|uniref:hypothetical protein n=1 Tax=Burkholderia multivorans TaxID=87883 RepID=UPI0019D0120E|nr:hypothetical protein [Burkholderia multivorans]QSL63975.1 hypothetical protein G0D86_29755 [Burkholderia multivorans]